MPLSPVPKTLGGLYSMVQPLHNTHITIGVVLTGVQGMTVGDMSYYRKRYAHIGQASQANINPQWVGKPDWIFVVFFYVS
jgi:hypothetical protein